MIENALENLDLNPVFTHAQTLVQNITIITPLITILHTLIVTDLAMTKILTNILQDQIVLVAQIIFQHLLVAHINLTHVLANALLVLTTPLLNIINHHIVFLLNHVMTATAVTLTLIPNQSQTINTNPLLTLCNNLFHLFTILALRNLSLK